MLRLRDLILLTIAFGLGSTGAFAQSTQVIGERQAAAQGILDAVRQNDKDLIDREVLGAPGSGPKGLGIAVFPTGRLRTTENDGFNRIALIRSPSVFDDGNPRSFAFSIDEASAFMNLVIRAPENVMGGELKVSAFVGYTRLSLEVRPNDANPADNGSIGSGRNELVLAGGSALWARDSAYAMVTLVGNWGASSVVDKIGTFPGEVHGYSYRTYGFVGTFTTGKVFPLTGSPTGPMLDLRGALAYTENKHKPFLNLFGDEFRIRFSTWSGTASATLFTNLPQPNQAFVRPYVMAYVRQDFAYDYKLHFVQSGSFAVTETAYDQSHTFGGADVGLAYTYKDFTFGLSAYYEQSADERTLGARFRLSWQNFGSG